MKVLDEQGLSYLLSKLDSRYDVSGKVDKVDGKGLSTNDYTTTEKNKLAGIAAGAEVNVQSDWNQTNSAADDYIKNKPTIPTVNNNTIVIQKNSTNVDSFTLNQSSNKTINITVPTKTSDLTNDSGYITDISGKADSSAAIGSISLSMDSNTYKISITGTKVNGTAFTVSDVIDLPLESVVVSGSYDSTNKKVVLTLKSGSTVEFSIADLINGLQSTIDANHKLSADLISDGTTNKVYTSAEKTKLSGIETGAQKNPDVLQTGLITQRDYYSQNIINGIQFSNGIKVLQVEDTNALYYYTATGTIHEYPRIILKGVSSANVVGCVSNYRVSFSSSGQENAGFQSDNLQFNENDYVLYRSIYYSNSDRSYVYRAEAVIQSTDSVLTNLNLIKGEDDLLYQIHPENGDVTPLSHPDLSTQPSILPQRFGKYDIKEVLLPIEYKENVPFQPDPDTLYYNDSTVLSLQKDEKFVNGDIMEISLFGNGYCTHPTVKLEDNTYQIYPMIPYEDMSKLEFALIRYMTVRDNYYYVPEVDTNEGRILYEAGYMVVKYSSNVHFDQTGPYTINTQDGERGYIISKNNAQAYDFASGNSSDVNGILRHAMDSGEQGYLAKHIGGGIFATHQIIYVVNDEAMIEEITFDS